MKLRISLVLETDIEKNAHAIISKLKRRLSFESPCVERYRKGGFRVRIVKELQRDSWPDALFDGLVFAQSFGRSWTILDRVEEELNLVGNDFSISGIVWAEISMTR